MSKIEKFGLTMVIISCATFAGLFVLGNGSALNAYNTRGEWINPIGSVVFFLVGMFLFILPGKDD